MENLLQVEALSIHNKTSMGETGIVHCVDYAVARGEVLGIVGESGSGKSVSSMALLGLLRPPLKVAGKLWLGGETYDLNAQNGLASLRGKEIGMIFQDARAALNPVRTIGAHFFETLQRHRPAREATQKQEILALLSAAGIGGAERRLTQYPHQLSGGLCQRVMIALALAARPRILIADEPTTALDTTVQAQVLDLIDQIRKEEGMAVIFISHDLAVIGDIADRVVVMRDGAVVETATCTDLFSAPKADYTKSLVDIALSGLSHSQAGRVMNG